MLSSSSFPDWIEDCIGEESCANLVPFLEEEGRRREADDDDDVAADQKMRRMITRKRNQRSEKKEYPPPIPLLARTENLHSHMPWVLKRTYTTDGRLVLWEEPVRHHEYFRAHRSDGRLTLHLVPLDDQVFGEADGETENENGLCHCINRTEENTGYPDNNTGGNIQEFLEVSNTETANDGECGGFEGGDESSTVAPAKAEFGGVGKCVDVNVYNMNVVNVRVCSGVAVPAL